MTDPTDLDPELKAMPVVVFQLSKTFYDESRGEVRAVDKIDFECHPGEVFGLLGANGAGKTTTLRMLSTILEPSSGKAYVQGHEVRRDPEGVRRSLGFYSASTALYPRLTGRETLEFFARINRYPAARVGERVDGLIERFGIGEYADARVDKLSSGMKQKVSIARTVAHDPPILIFDEPTVGLDVLAALELQQVIRELKEEGKTIVFSTHIMSEAEKLCDRIAIIHRGRILVCDTLDGLRGRSGAHYLEDIFVHYVRDVSGDEAVADAETVATVAQTTAGAGERWRGVMAGGSVLWTLYRYELRMLARDRRTLVVSVLLPILIMPAFIGISLWNERAREERYEATVFDYAVSGPESDLLRDLATAGNNEAELERLRRPSDDEDPLWQLREKESADPAAELAAQDLHFFVVTRSAVDAGGLGGLAADSPLAEDLELPLLRIVFRANWDESVRAAREMEERLLLGRQVRRAALLDERGFGVRVDRVVAVEPYDVATAEQRGGLVLGRFAALVLLLFLITGGSVVAADTIAGEKERGTLETVLTTAVSRGELVAAKQLVILTVGVVISLVQIANLAIYVGLEVIEVPESFAVDLSPLTLLVLLWLFLPLAGLVAGVLLLASGRARTYKEFQFYHFPIFVVTLALGAAALLPGVVLRSGIVLVPVANLSVAVREVLTGRFDVPMLMIAWLISAAAAVLGARWTMASLSKEQLITGGGLDRGEWRGGAALFPRRVLAWFAVMWTAIFLGASSVPLFRNLHGQLLFNLVIVMLGGSLLMIRHYRLDFREALALRPVKPVVLLAVVLGAPGLFLTGVALARLSGALFPLPERLLEGFGRTLLPEAMPMWEMLLILAVLPGICEEVTFRGVLLHGLRRRFSPPVLCLMVGLIFGLFHVSLVRVLPTAFLGVTVAAVTLVTGSLYPAMLWHALHNAAAFLAADAGFAVDELGAGVYAAGAAVAALALTLLWKNRTPYPGLRGGWPFTTKPLSEKKKRGT